MGFKRRRFLDRFFALLTILSFTFTQASPALALRPSLEGTSQSGLEEVLQKDLPAALPDRSSIPAAPVSLSARGVGSDAFAAAYQALGAFPPALHNTREMTLKALEILSAGLPPDKARKIPNSEEMAAQLDQLIARTPNINCPTCGAKLAHALLGDVFADPERTRPEALQSPQFQEAERLNALLLALGAIHQGRLQTMRGPDGHLLPASSAADLRDLLTLTQAIPGVPQEAVLKWEGFRMTQRQLEQALQVGHEVIVHVGGNHFVRVTAMEAGRVEYTDPQEMTDTGRPGTGVSSLPARDFFQWWKGNAREDTAGVVLAGSRPGQTTTVQKRMTAEELAQIIGCCGINATFAHFRSLRKILDAVLRLMYRSPDDAGILVINGKGLQYSKVQGTPADLILQLLAEPLYPEELDLPEGPAQNRNAVGEYRIERRALLIDEGLQTSPWVTPEWEPDPGRNMNDLHTSNVEGLYAGTFTVGMGDVGGLFSGWVYTLGESPNEYQALNGPLLNLDDMVSRWDVTPEFIKLFIRYSLMQRLPQDPQSQDRISALADFDRLGDRAMKQALDPDEQAVWNALWSKYLQGQTIRVSPDFNRDPVRHIFRLLDQMVGYFRGHPEWEKAVQDRFEQRRPPQRREWNWRTYWEQEYRYNMPGHAFASLVDWFQDWTLEQGLAPPSVHGAWARRREEQEKRRGFSEGTVDMQTLFLLPEIVLGHGRWAMTGDPKWWNAHPQVTTERAIVHNGAIEADKNNELRTEHEERYQSEMKAAAALGQERPFDSIALAQSQAMEQRARRDYGKFEDADGKQEIVTDTRTIVRQWQLIAQDYKEDQADGLVTDGLVDSNKPGRLNRMNAMYEGRAVFDRAAAWNQVVKNLVEYEKVPNPNPDEVALRVAMMELAPGSGIATDGVSLATPLTEFVTSHDRPVDIVVYQHADETGRVLYEDYMVTSDYAAAIGLFPASAVSQAARQIAVLEREALTGIDQLRSQLRDHRMGEEVFAKKVTQEISRLQEGLDHVILGQEVRGIVDGKVLARRKGGFHVQVYHLKGMEKFARVTRRLNAEGKPVVEVQISKFNGESLDPEEGKKMLQPVDEVVNPSLGDRGGFENFMEKHIAEIPLILLKQALNYIQVPSDGGKPMVVLDAVFPEGVKPEVVQDENGLHTRLAEGAKILRHGVNGGVIRKHFGAAAGLEEKTHQLPGLKRVILVGVGSSWRDAKIAQAIFEELLPGVEILVYDPVDIQNRGVTLDPKSDLLVGMSWSGSTDSMVRLFNRLEADGFVTIAITGKPGSDMGRIGQHSGGTINVLSGDEQTVATTKGFESVLYSLSLLGVQLSQLQANPALEDLRNGYVRDLRQVADLVYDVLSEAERPRGSKILDLGDAQSLLNRLGQQYAKRQKLLWVGSRNVPIHVEGELKGEEIASIVGLAVDIEDSSWQATVTPNFDPDAKEEDKVIFGFDMTDPDRFEADMTEIRSLAEAGADFLVVTFEADGNPHYEELEFLAGQHQDKIHLITVPHVRLTLQPLITALVHFRFGVALAKGRKMKAAQIENSRCLAKSVTVSYAQQLKELLLATKTKIITMVQQATQWAGEMSSRLSRHLQLLRGKIWGGLVDTRRRAIERLPSVLQRAYGSFFQEGSWLTTGESRQRMEGVFGPKGEGIRQIVIVADEEATEYAGYAAEDPLGAVEVVFSGTGQGTLYDAEKTKVSAPFKGIYYRVGFDRSSGTYHMKFDPSIEQNKGVPPPATAEFSIPPQTEEVTVNGYRYAVDPTSFAMDKKKPNNVAFGLTLRAVNPDLLGVKVKVFRASDKALVREMDRADTLFVLVSRSNNRHQHNYRIPPISGGVEDERTPTDTAALSEITLRPEAAMLQRAQELAQRGGRFVCLCDLPSALSAVGSGSGLGNVPLPKDLDDTSLYSVTYMGLLSIGVKLGQLRGIDTQRYQTALGTVPGLVAGVLRNAELKKRMERFVSRFGNYKKIHAIGGGQAYADAREFARVLRTLGVFAEAQLNDSAWHGPLASVDPSREKFLDKDRRVGINPDFNPANDTLVLIGMTDYRFFNTALGGDAQVYDSRNARFGLVIKASDEKLDAVRKVGAAEDGIFPLADFPDELGNFASAVFGQIFASTFAEAHRKALGRAEFLPPAGGLLPAVSPLARAVEDSVQRSVSFRSFSGELTGLLQVFASTKKPQCSEPLARQDYPDSVFLLMAGEDRPGLLANISNIFRNARISIYDYFPPNIPGFEGTICFRLTPGKKEDFPSFAGRVASLREKILEALVVPTAVSLPGLPPPTAGQKLDPAAYPVGRVLATFAARLVHAGMIGAGKKQKEADLEKLGERVKGWAGVELRAIAVETPGLAFVSGTDRIGYYRIVTEGERHDALVNAVDNVTTALAPPAPGAEPRECALSYAVFGPGLRDVGDPERIPRGFYAQILAFEVPPGEEGEQLKKFASENPLMPVDQVAGFLGKIARARGEHPPLVEVQNLLGRDRERLFAAEFQRLAQEGLIRNASPKNGTVEMALRSNIPASSRPAPGRAVVTWTTGLLHQAMASLYLSKAMPEGALVLVRILPDASIVNRQPYLNQASASNPIGGADAFAPEHRAQLEAWLGKERAGRVLRGEWFSTLDIKDPVYGALVPLTPTNALPFPVSGITAVEGAEIPGGQRYRVPVIRVQDGNVWLQEEEVDLPPLAAGERFEVPPTSPLAPEKEPKEKAELPAADQFADQIKVLLNNLNLQGPQADEVVRQAMPALQRFQETDLPQTVAVAHPSGQEGRSVLVAIDRQHESFVTDVEGAVQKAGMKTEEFHKSHFVVGGVDIAAAVVHIAIDDVGNLDLEKMREYVEAELTASRLFEEFESRLRKLNLSPPEVMVTLLAYLKAQKTQDSFLNVEMVPVPRGQQPRDAIVAFAFASRLSENETVQGTFEKALTEKGISFELAASTTEEFFVHPKALAWLRKEPYRMWVYRLKDVDPEALGEVMASFKPSPKPGAPSLEGTVPVVMPTPEVLPEDLRPHEALIQGLAKQFAQDQVIHLEHAAVPGKDQTLFIIVGGRKRAGLQHAIDRTLVDVSPPLAITGEYTYPTDGEGLLCMFVDAPYDDLKNRLRPELGEKAVIQTIEERFEQALKGQPTQPSMVLRDSLLKSLSEQFAVDRQARFEAAYDEKAGHTTMVAVGPPGMAGFTAALVDPVSAAGIEILSHGPGISEMLDPAAKVHHTYVVVPHTPQRLGVLGVLNAIEKRVSSLTSPKPQGPPSAPSAGLEEAAINPGTEPAAEVVQAAQERGWQWDAGMRLFRTGEKGWVSPEAVLGFETKVDGKTGAKSWAAVKNGALVRGATTKIAAAATMDSSLIEDADVRGGSITGAVVRTDPSLADDWSWNGTYAVGRAAQTVIGENVIIGRGVDGEPAEIVNAAIGAWSYVYGGSIRNSQIGQKNRILRAKVGLTHTEDNVTIETKNGAPTELSECWIGWGRTIDTESFNEQLSPNLVRRAWVDADGMVKFETVQDLPAVVIQGFSTIDASYDGTGKVGKEFTSSRHGKGIKFPGSIMGPRVTAIWRVHPDFESPEDFFRAESLARNTSHGQLTALHPFSYSVKENPGDASGEVWGQVVPGSARRGLSPRQSDPLWVFKGAGRAINEILSEMHKQVTLHAQTVGWDVAKTQEVHRQVDLLPRYALETGKAVARLEKNDRLEAEYDQTLQALAQNENKVRNEGLTLAELTAADDPTEGDWKDKQLFLDEDLDALHNLPEGIEISPDSVIGKDVKIIGARARLNGVQIPDGATVFVWGSVVEGAFLADGAEVRSSILRGDPRERILVDKGAKLAAVRAIRLPEKGSLPVQFHEGVKATHAVVEGSIIGKRTTLEPYARFSDTSVGTDGAVGSIVMGSRFGDWITSHHLAGGRVYHVRTPGIPDPQAMSTVRVPVLANLSSGGRYFGTPEKPIFLGTTMTAANLLAHEGVETGFGSFVKGEIPADTKIPPFGFWQGKKLGLAPVAMTRKLVNYIMRMVLGKTIKATPESGRPAINRVMQKALKDAGLTDEMDGRWELGFLPGKDAPTFPKGQWVYKPLYPGEKEGNGSYEWVPAQAAAAQPAAGLEEAEVGLGELKEQMNLLPAAASLTPSIGVIAGPQGLAYGVALSQLKASNGSPLPVVFLIENDAEEAFLKGLGFTDGAIFRDISSAREWLGEIEAVNRIEEIGVGGPVTQTSQLILRNLFGIELNSGQAGIWERFMDRVTGALSTAA